jgi:predicted metalloprotease with PDZ domain
MVLTISWLPALKSIDAMFLLSKISTPAFVKLLFVACVAAIGLPRFISPAAANPVAAVGPRIAYTIDCRDTKNHYLHITAKIKVAKKQKQTKLTMATWAPGSYLIREYARHVDSITMIDQAGSPVDFNKVNKNYWNAKTDGVDELTIKYRLYCNEMTVRTNWAGDSFIVLHGAATFITTPETKRRKNSYSVKLNMPKRWKRSFCSLPKAEGLHHYVAGSFDELVDNPIVAGNIQVYPFEAGGIPHQLVNVGESGYWDGTKAAADLKKVVETHQQMWGSVPYKRYAFINVISESRGGLEHDNCTVMMTSRWSFRDKEKYNDWLSLCSHEFFHTWNVRRLRPKSLLKYDYQQEMYTRNLWIAEGITSYYENLALVRAGLIDRKAYLKRLTEDLEAVQKHAGRKVQSLADSSFDTWIKFYRPDENSKNTRVSYYSKGAVTAFLLDTKLRKLTKGKKSLDHVMRLMYERFSTGGYTSADFRSVAKKVAKQDLSDWFAKNVDSANEFEFDDLAVLGIEIPDLNPTDDLETDAKETDIETSEDDESESSELEKKEKKPTPWLGLTVSQSGQSVVVSAVAPDSPAYKAGINVGDEIIALDGFRVGGNLKKRLDQLQIGDSTELLLARRGKLQRIKVELASDDSIEWKLKLIAKPNKKQAKQLDNWLNN